MSRDQAREQRPGGFTWAWVLWLALFLVVEGVALFNGRRGDTLSEHVWRWFSVRDRSTGWKAVRFGALIAFLGWLVVHFITGGWI